MELIVNSLQDKVPPRHIVKYLTIIIGNPLEDKEYIENIDLVNKLKSFKYNRIVKKIEESTYNITIRGFTVPQHVSFNVYYITTDCESISKIENINKWITSPSNNHLKCYSYKGDLEKDLNNFLKFNDKNIKYFTYCEPNFYVTLWEPIIMPE